VRRQIRLPDSNLCAAADFDAACHYPYDDFPVISVALNIPQLLGNPA